MKVITLDRMYRPAHGLYSIGHLYDADGKYICDTIVTAISCCSLHRCVL